MHPEDAVAELDTGYLGIPGAAAVFLVRAPGAPVLVETGCAATFEAVRAGLAAHGVAPRDLAAVLVTHVHLDHAGAAGHFAREGVPVLVHPRGARHLADPARLIAGSRAVHGPRYDAHYGDPLPIDPARIRAIEDGDSAELGGWRFEAIATPGHARHHHAWLAGPAGLPPRELFAGDVLGMVTPGSRFIAIPAPPSDIDLAAWRASLARIAALPGGLRCLLTHGGGRPLAPHLAEFTARFDEETALLAGLVQTDDAGGNGGGNDGGNDGGNMDAEAADRRYRDFLAPRIAAAGVRDELAASLLGRAFRAMNIAGVAEAVRRATRVEE
ncbi:MAG: hypothetical protein RI967_1419 [Planctomycetota bacterium]